MKMLIAGGGTGGHLFPGIALAEELLTRQPNRNDVLFVGTAQGIEAKVVPQNNLKLELIEVSGLKRVGFLKRLKGLFRLPKAVWRSVQILRSYKPDVVVGVGGYASGPVVLAAWVMRMGGRGRRRGIKVTGSAVTVAIFADYTPVRPATSLATRISATTATMMSITTHWYVTTMFRQATMPTVSNAMMWLRFMYEMT